MPTENRSTMVSVPRETVDQAAELLQEYNKCSIARDLRAILAKSAQQHQGEPVAWRYLRVVPTGNARLDRPLLSLCPPGDWGEGFKGEPLYTHADPNVRWKAVADEQMQVIDSLRAQLAERDALLRDSSGKLVQMAAHLIGAPLRGLHDLQDEDKRMTRPRVDSAVDFADARLKDAAYEVRRIANALSASAEPSNALCTEGAHEFVPFRSECVKCGEPYRAEPSAPVERDERAEFERKFVVQEGVFFSQERNEYRSMNGRSIEETDSIDLNLRLSGWQARAALERKP